MKKLTAAFLSLLLVMTCANAAFADLPAEDSWCYDALNFAVENQLLTGTADGMLDPDGALTRGQMAAIIARAFGAGTRADVSAYTDLTSAWQREQFGLAVQMGVFGGYEDGTLRPTDRITREQAFAVLARAFLLTEDGDDGAALRAAFSDAAEVGAWARGALCAMTEAGYIRGNNGKLNPKGWITRAQFAQVVYNMLGSFLTEPGTYSSVKPGSVMVTAADTVLKDCTVTGDLIVGDGVGNGTFRMENVTVEGRLVLRGGGEHSVIVRDCAMRGIYAGRTDGMIRVELEQSDPGDLFRVCRGSADVKIEGAVSDVVVDAADITVTVAAKAQSAELMESAVHSKLVLAGGTLETVKTRAPESTIDLIDGTARTAATTQTALEAQILVRRGASVTSVEVGGAGGTVSGDGSVKSVEANADRVTVRTAGTEVIAAEGTTGVVAGGVPVSGGTGWTTAAGGGFLRSRADPAGNLQSRLLRDAGGCRGKQRDRAVFRLRPDDSD